MLAGRALHHIAGLLHHGFFGIMAAISAHAPVTAITTAPISGVMAPDVVLATVCITGATAISTTLIVSGLRVPAVLLQCTDFVDILDGVSELVDGLQITGRHFGLAGNLVQFVLELILQVI